MSVVKRNNESRPLIYTTLLVKVSSSPPVPVTKLSPSILKILPLCYLGIPDYPGTPSHDKTHRDVLSFLI